MHIFREKIVFPPKVDWAVSSYAYEGMCLLEGANIYQHYQKEKAHENKQLKIIQEIV